MIDISALFYFGKVYDLFSSGTGFSTENGTPFSLETALLYVSILFPLGFYSLITPELEGFFIVSALNGLLP